MGGHRSPGHLVPVAGGWTRVQPASPLGPSGRVGCLRGGRRGSRRWWGRLGRGWCGRTASGGPEAVGERGGRGECGSRGGMGGQVSPRFGCGSAPTVGWPWKRGLRGCLGLGEATRQGPLAAEGCDEKRPHNFLSQRQGVCQPGRCPQSRARAPCDCPRVSAVLLALRDLFHSLHCGPDSFHSPVLSLPVCLGHLPTGVEGPDSRSLFGY